MSLFCANDVGGGKFFSGFLDYEYRKSKDSLQEKLDQHQDFCNGVTNEAAVAHI